jgi:uncharacterized membrane protein
MNSAPFDPSMLAAFTLLPFLIFFVYALVMLVVMVFMIVMIFRFVKAHERIARQMETLVLQRAEERKPDGRP